jgi:hypothetical protein
VDNAKPLWKTKTFWANLLAALVAVVLNAVFPDPQPAVMGDDFDPTLPKGDILTWLIFGQTLLNWLIRLWTKEPAKL